MREHACNLVTGVLGSDLVWSMSQDQDSMSRSWTTCLKVRHSGSLIVLEGSGHYLFQLAPVLKRLTWAQCGPPNSLLFWRQVHLAVTVQLSYVCQGCLSWSWTYIVCLPDCLAMRLVLQSTTVGNRWPRCFAASATY